MATGTVKIISRNRSQREVSPPGSKLGCRLYTDRIKIVPEFKFLGHSSWSSRGVTPWSSWTVIDQQLTVTVNIKVFDMGCVESLGEMS